MIFFRCEDVTPSGGERGNKELHFWRENFLFAYEIELGDRGKNVQDYNTKM